MRESRYCRFRRLPKMHPLCLFLLRKNHGYDGGTCISNGLRNSAKFVVDMLLVEGKRAKLIEVVDSNSIDKVVHEEKPARVVLEAIWVTPAKMRELIRLHPLVKWTVRIHSETTFLAQEGMAIGWITEYLLMGVEVAFNSGDTTADFQHTFSGKITYLPNFYPLRKPRTRKHPNDNLDVGCFGAIRPLKNQLIQAMAALIYARKIGKNLRFHINGNRSEMNGDNNLKNIKALLGKHVVLHPWMDHEEFLETICLMDICMNVSLTESFAIVSADAISMGVPLVGSSAIKWLPERSQAPVDSALGIVHTLGHADETMVWMNHHALTGYLKKAVDLWVDWIG